jgi:hypothetical protein
MITFNQDPSKTLKMYYKIIEEVCREPLGEIQFGNKRRENKMGGGALDAVNNYLFIVWTIDTYGNNN